MKGIPAFVQSDEYSSATRPTTVVPTMSDSDVIFYLQVLSKTLNFGLTQLDISFVY